MAKILVVDDEVELKNLVVNSLLAHSHVVRGCTSGDEALEILRAEHFDLLLSDLTMPKMTGLALVEAALEIDPNLVTIIMTGMGATQLAGEATSLGVFDYLQKPFTMRTMMPVVTRALDSRNSGNEVANHSGSRLADLLSS